MNGCSSIRRQTPDIRDLAVRECAAVPRRGALQASAGAALAAALVAEVSAAATAAEASVAEVPAAVGKLFLNCLE